MLPLDQFETASRRAEPRPADAVQGQVRSARFAPQPFPKRPVVYVKPDYYRRKADHVRELAQRVTDQALRRHLRVVALHYEKLAAEAALARR